MFESRSCAVCTGLLAITVSGAAAQADTRPERVDYLTFASGAIPVAISGRGAQLGANWEHAVRIVDGDPTFFPIVSRADSTTDTEFVYELPASTTFDRFAVPEIRETPSPSQTFTRRVEICGSATAADAGFTLLAAGSLTTHAARGQVTELTMAATIPVRWVKVRLIGGIALLRPQMFLEFGEIIGNGAQQTPALSDRFEGIWRGRGVLVQLRQEGAAVAGCYDRTGDLTGTVTGNILRATGVARSTDVPSAFVLSITADGALRGV